MKKAIDREQSGRSGNKKRYVRPMLSNFGTVEELTQGTGSHHNDSGGPFNGNFPGKGKGG